MTIDELVETVARAMCHRIVCQGASEAVVADRVDRDWHNWEKDARAALRASIGPLMEMAAERVSKGEVWSDTPFSTAIRVLAAEMQEKLG